MGKLSGCALPVTMFPIRFSWVFCRQPVLCDPHVVARASCLLVYLHTNSWVLARVCLYVCRPVIIVGCVLVCVCVQHQGGRPHLPRGLHQRHAAAGPNDSIEHCISIASASAALQEHCTCSQRCWREACEGAAAAPTESLRHLRAQVRLPPPPARE